MCVLVVSGHNCCDAGVSGVQSWLAPGVVVAGDNRANLGEEGLCCRSCEALLVGQGARGGPSVF